MPATCTRTCTLHPETKRSPEHNPVPRLNLRDSFAQWRRRESNPRPRIDPSKRLRACYPVVFATGLGQGTADLG